MTSKVRRIVIIVALAVALSIGGWWLAFSFSWMEVTSEIGSGGLSLSVDDLSAVPQSVAEDAARLATELYGDYQEKSDEFVSQLLALYSEAKDEDFIVLFNLGGWGWNLVEDSPGWWSIFTGIKSELDNAGYTSLLLNYRRTVDTLRGRLNELVEMVTGYSSKAENLAYRVEFLTSHIPELRVILAGESTGAVISDKVMNILQGNPQVYSIQTGPPFWHDNIVLDRTLVMTDNGRTPDSFSRGEFLIMIRANLRALFGLPQPENESGIVFRYVHAPGHDYWWQYPEVYSQITNFLDKNFGSK